jgi:conserved oligomeric Golgi complex subunit 6
VKVLAGLCAPLRLRIEQVLHGSHAVLVTFQIYQLLEFYRSTIHQLMKAESQLLETLVQLQGTAAAGVRNHMSNLTDRLSRGSMQLPSDLSCPPAVREVVSQLVQVAGVYESDLQGLLPLSDGFVSDCVTVRPIKIQKGAIQECFT